jgi:hypothetical protein
MHLSCPPYVPRTLPISFFISRILFGEQYRSSKLLTLQYLPLSCYLISRRPKISSSAPCEAKHQGVVYVGRSYNKISETLRTPESCKQNCTCNDDRFNSKNKLVAFLASLFRITARVLRLLTLHMPVFCCKVSVSLCAMFGDHLAYCYSIGLVCLCTWSTRFESRSVYQLS